MQLVFHILFFSHGLNLKLLNWQSFWLLKLNVSQHLDFLFFITCCNCLTNLVWLAACLVLTVFFPNADVSVEMNSFMHNYYASVLVYCQFYSSLFLLNWSATYIEIWGQYGYLWLFMYFICQFCISVVCHMKFVFMHFMLFILFWNRCLLSRWHFMFYVHIIVVYMLGIIRLASCIGK